MCHDVSMAAFDAAGDPDALPARGRAVAAAEALLQPDASAARGSWPSTRRCWPPGLESPYAEWLERWEDRGERPITTRVARAPTTSTSRDRALLAHATQVDPDGTWFRGARCEMQREVWPTEDFEAALSLRARRRGRGRPVRRARHRGGGHALATAPGLSDRLRHRTERPAVNTPSTVGRAGPRRVPRLLPARDRAVAAHAQHEQADAPDVLPRGAGGRGRGRSGARRRRQAGRRAHRGPAPRTSTAPTASVRPRRDDRSGPDGTTRRPGA